MSTVDNIQGLRDVLTPDSRLGRGLAWPPSEDPATGDFAKAEAEVSISSCLINLLTTRLGELSPLITVGTRFHEILFSVNDKLFIAEIVGSIKRAINVNEPRITVTELSYAIRNVTPSSRVVEISMTYRIKATGQTRQFIYILPPSGASV